MGARVEIGAAEEIASPIEAMLSFVKRSEEDSEERRKTITMICKERGPV